MVVVGLVAFAVGCAQGPGTACDAGECGDAGAVGGGSGGGGATGGGSGGGAAIDAGEDDAGVDGGTDGGAVDAGITRTPVAFAFSSLGIPNQWADVESALPAPMSALPTYSRVDVSLPALALPAGCTEVFRGAIALPDGRVLAIPACASRFAIIDPVLGTASWVGDSLPEGPQGGSRGRYGGAVLGCDLRVYALPGDGYRRVRRVTVESDAGLTFEEVRTVTDGGLELTLSGAVVARPCSATEGMLVIAGGYGGFMALNVFEEAIDVVSVPVLDALGRHVDGVARIGDSEVVGAPAAGASDVVVPWLDTAAWSTRAFTRSSDTALRHGVATLRQQDALVLTEGGSAHVERADGGMADARTFTPAHERLRWPTNSLTGWVFASGDALLAFEERPDAGDVEVLSPASSSTGAFTSGGLVLTPSGALVSVPGEGDQVISIFWPANTTTAPSAGLVLSPWFNKL